VVLGGTNLALENPTLVDNFALFNINNNTPGAPGNGTTPTGPFRSSMQLSGLALTTLNDCPDATLIATAIDVGPTAQITTITPPPFPFVVGERIDIDGVNVGGSGPLFFPHGYNGIGVFQISKVISRTTFQYESFGSPITGLPAGSGGAVNGLFPRDVGVCSKPPNFVTFPVDTGTRFIELGWAGDGSPIDTKLMTPPRTTDFNCVAALNAGNQNPANLNSVLGAFSMGAVRHHFALTNARVPGLDFRCPTAIELNGLVAFQKYLGRQYPSGKPLELALKTGTTFPGTQVSPSQPGITFNDSTAEKGKTIFLDPNAGCQFCHFNGGASLSSSNIRTEPFGNPPLPFPGRNEDEEQNVDLLTDNTFEIPSTGQTVTGGLDGLTPVSIGGTDPGDGSPIQGTAGVLPIFNVQSIIEAPRKKSFFHNGVFNTSVEDAASFYFTDAFVADANFNVFSLGTNEINGMPVPIALGLTLPRGPGQPEGNPSGGAALALTALANTYFPSDSVTGDVLTSPGGQDVLNTMGFFLRALNVVYSIADCERLMSDANTIARMNQPTTVQVLNCTTDLNDVNHVIGGAKVQLAAQYISVQNAALQLVQELQQVAATNASAGPYTGEPVLLGQILNNLVAQRHAIANISPDLQLSPSS
jgi:hypothetical protein